MKLTKGLLRQLISEALGLSEETDDYDYDNISTTSTINQEAERAERNARRRMF